MTEVRRPVVAGTFYPGHPGALEKAVAGCIGDTDTAPATGGIVPHAGYIYSGSTAGAFFAAANVPDRVVLLGPKHTHAGADFALWPAGSWETPLGEVPVDEDLAAAVLERCPGLEPEEAAHREEHSLEVVLPFVQYVNREAKIVPIAFSPMSLAMVADFGGGIAAAVSEASSDRWRTAG